MPPIGHALQDATNTCVVKGRNKAVTFRSHHDRLIHCRTALVALVEHQCCTLARTYSGRTQAVEDSMPEGPAVRAAQIGTHAVAAAVVEAAEEHVPDPVRQAVVPRNLACACAGASHPLEVLYR